MSGVEFDRQVFAPTAEQAPKAAPRLGGLLVLILVIAVLVFAGYKILKNYSVFAPSTQPPSLDQMQQQLADMQKRLTDLEKHHKNSVAAPPVALATTETTNSTHAVRPVRPAYLISGSSVMKPQNTPARSMATNSQPAAATPRPADNLSEDTRANHEAWEATTNRLANVVGVIGTQQGEISATRDQLNQLLAQTERTAIQFEIRRGAGKQPIGPVSLVLKGSDSKSQRYTLCVYLGNQCIELKDRVVDEVVVFIVSRNSAPLELVATKVGRDTIVGYLEVPTGQTTP